MGAAASTVLQTNGTGTLSNGNLTYTSTQPNSLCRSDRIISGPCYWECTPTNLSAGILSTGICGSSLTFNSLQSSSSALHYDNTTGNIGQSSNSIGTAAAWAVNQRQGWALDPVNRLVWVRIAGGLWNNSGTANPATGVGGFSYDIATWNPIGGIVPAAHTTAAAGSINYVFNAANFVDAAPAGFSSLDVLQFTAKNVEENFAAEIFPLVEKEFGPIARACWPPDQRYLYYWQPSGPMKFVSGYTKENGVIVPNKRVDMYDRDSGELITTTTSDATGFFSLPTIGRSVVRVVGSDPTTYNSIVWDNVPAV